MNQKKRESHEVPEAHQKLVIERFDSDRKDADGLEGWNEAISKLLWCIGYWSGVQPNRIQTISQVVCRTGIDCRVFDHILIVSSCF